MNKDHVLLPMESINKRTMPISNRNFSRMKAFLRSYKALAFLIATLLLLGAFSRAMKGFGHSYVAKNMSFVRRYLDFGIMLDAGSTGSRIHVFAFQKLEDGTLKLIDEVFKHTKPGLSSFAKNPKKGAETINKLLQIGKDVIPPTKWHTTPVALKATAGLRLLPAHQSEQLLKEVYNVFRKSPFKVSGPESVSIMDGLYEGIYAWVTVNFLTGGFTNKGMSLFGALDLGGGSTQITFNPMDEATLKNSPKDFIHITEVFGHKYTLYTHSYLGLGLMAARASISKQGVKDKDTDGKNISKSPCLGPKNVGEWKFGGSSITVSGHANHSFQACMSHVRSLVRVVDRQDEMNSRKFYAFSYFYDRAADMKLIDFKKGGIITVGDFIAKADEVCSTSQLGRKKQLLCMDATFISAILRYGYGLHKDRQLILRKKINGVELSWALGATLDLFNKEMKNYTPKRVEK